MGIRKLPSGKWIKQVQVDGARVSKTFATKKEAEQWEPVRKDTRTVADLLDKYDKEIIPRKKSPKREHLAVGRILRDAEFASVRLSDLGPRHVAAWRDKRGETVSGSSVYRELNIISHAFGIARREWQWLDREITRDVGRPKTSPPRSRVPTEQEIELLVHCLGAGVGGRVADAFLFALETGMRAKEICGIRPEHVDGRVANVVDSKTSAGVRHVPLTPKAQDILLKHNYCFGLVPSQIDANFRKAKKKAGITDLHFHDSRRAALTRMAKVLDPLALAKIAGHTNMQMLIKVYYKEDIDEIADKLATLPL